MARNADTPMRARFALPSSFRTVAAFRAAIVLFALVGGISAAVAGGATALLAESAGASIFAEPAQAAFALGLLGSLVAVLFMLALFPLFRRVLAMRQDVQLLEAASPVHPLLKRLMAEAPGTYMHSLAVANMAEAAAEAIGANPLLARVGAYYHDVGKVFRPCFFFENQEDRNPHDIAKPSISATIITAHVRDGLDLAEKYRLPDPVRDIVREHHGTTLVRYFYHRATEQDAGVFEADFRYTGGTPSSREAALVMLADGSEAAVRALGQPSRESIEGSVRRLIEERRADGQLSGSGLTDDDLETTVKTFGKMLMSLYHLRCEYPEVACRETRGESVADQRVESS